MLQFVLFALFVQGSVAVTVSAKATKTMTVSSPDGANKMFVEHSSVSDLDSSASGYIYRSDGKNPATVVHLGEPGYAEPQEFSQLMNYGYGAGPAHSQYEQGHGSASDGGHYSNHGAKGDHGYKSYEDFHNALMKKFLKNQDSGFYNQAAGEKKGHHSEGGSYGGYDAANHGQVGGSFKEDKSHKKGEKTTGFHNVYHKDEYKKQHSFYDESDNSGHADKYGHGGQSYGAEHGGYKKGGFADSGYQQGDYGKKGGYDHGSFSGAAKGSAGVEGGSSHYANDADYANKGGSDSQKGFGYSSGTGYGYGH